MRRVIHRIVRPSLFLLALLVALPGQPVWGQTAKTDALTAKPLVAKKGTVTSLSAGAGITLTPNPITTTGTISVATGGVTNSMISPSAAISPSKIAGTAATLGANSFSGNQSITGSLSLTDSLQLPGTTSSTVGVIYLGSSPFLHDFGGSAANNTFVGSNAGNFALTGNANTALGATALGNDTTGFGNTAVGSISLTANTTGVGNTAVGTGSLGVNTTGSDGTAVGNGALLSNTGGNSNTAVGGGALNHNTTGFQNTALGSGALGQNLTGQDNIAIGAAGANLTTGSFDIYIGDQVGEGENPVSSSESNTIRIGLVDPLSSSSQTRAFIAGISGVTTGGVGTAVYVDSNGQLGTISSSRRYKYDIRAMRDVSDELLRLRPVTFRYKQAQNNGAHPLQYGLVAEEVAKVDPGLVSFDNKGEPQTVLYQYLPSMLLNEVQKQHQQLETQEKTIRSQRQQLKSLEARLQRLEATLPKQGQ